MTRGHHPAGGAGIPADFRDSLIIDRYDPLFAALRTSRRRHGASGDDAVAWNVFRSLRQIDPTIWLPELFRAAFPTQRAAHCELATVAVWQSIAAPPGLAGDVDEGESEVDVLIETPSWVWLIDTKQGSDAGATTATPSRRDRGQVLRGIDAGSWHAGVRDFYYSLLVADAGRSSAGAGAIAGYRDLAKVREQLAPHRPDGLVNLRGVSLLTWSDLGDVMSDAATDARREDERAFAVRAGQWLASKGLAGRAV